MLLKSCLAGLAGFAVWTAGAPPMAPLAALWFAPATAQAATFCGFAPVIAAYEKGLAVYGLGKYALALTRWRPVAEAGFPPAQRRLGELLAAGKGTRAKPGEAAFWARLAAKAGDGAAPRLVARLRGRHPDLISPALDRRIAAWRPKEFDCAGQKRPVKRSKKFSIVSDYGYRVSFSRGVHREQRERIRKRLALAIQAAERLSGAPRLLLSMIDGFDVAAGGRYSRYVGWKGGGGHFIRLSSGNFNDKAPLFLARAILLAVKRRIYGRLKGETFADPLMRMIGGKRVFGSIYPDIKNDRYFKMIAQAFEMAKKLPRELHRYVDIVDEIHYNPLSKHYIRSGTLDASAAYYNKVLSHEGHRLIFVRRDVLYSSALFFLRSFVHEGTHAAQDRKAWRYNQEVPKLRRRLRRLDGARPGAARKLEAEIAKKFNYVIHWYMGVKTTKGRIPDIRFECEATLNEIETVRSVGGSPAAMNDSAYVKLCPEAIRRLTRWRDQSFTNRRRH